MNVGDIEYIVSVETQQSIDAARNFDKSMDSVQQTAKRTDGEVNKLGAGFNKLALAIKTVIAATALRQMAGMVQEYQTMAERVKMATDSAEEYRLVQKRLQDTADGTYRSLSEAQELYIRTADSLKAMGYATEELVDIQDSMSYAFVTNATSADRARAAISQFTKAVNTGRVSADQWETITSALPSVINDIADASGKSASEVRALGAAGKLAARDLTEGLRASLEQNRDSADGMATDLIDASVRIKNAITVTMVAIEDQTGAIQGVTDGIIKASEALLAFGNDSESIADLLDAAAIAGASLAAVIAGRIVTALGSSAVAMYQNTIGARALVAAELAAAEAGAALAAQQLIEARAAVAAAGGKSMSSGASARLTVAENAATAASARLTAAQTAMRGAFTASAAAATALRATMAFLGGPAGLIMLAAVAIYAFASRAREATKPTHELTASIADLGKEMREVRRIDIGNRLDELEKLAVQMKRNIEFSERYDTSKMSDKATKKMLDGLQRERGALEQNRKEVDALRAALAELDDAKAKENAMGPPVPETDAGTGGGAPGQLTEFQKLEQSYQNQIDLARKTGLARAELAALQRLGAEATTEEKDRISELVGELYKLEKQTKANEKAAEAAAQGNAENAQVLADLREQLHQTTLEPDALIQRQAELSMNEYATPEQIAAVRALALELRNAQQEALALEQRKSAFGADSAGAIRGDVVPLSGGAFDDQTARYAAEADAEKERYANQLARLQEAKDLQLEVEGGYYALEQKMAKEHADRMAQIDQARTSVMLNAYSDGFGAIAGILKASQGEQSKAYRGMFAASQAFLVADTSMQVYNAIAKAWASAPFPANLPAVTTATAQATPLIAKVASATISGGRRQGGPVSPGSMYRVNEGGRPEVFQNNLGQQYMIPDARGKVVSNRDATGAGGKSGLTVNIHNAPPGTRAQERTGPTGEQILDVWLEDFNRDGRTAQAVFRRTGTGPQGR